MLNAEKYRKEILNNYSKGFSIIDGHIDDCESIACESCLFSHSKNDDGYLTCINRKVKWLLSEYKEPVKLTRLDYEILKHVQKEGFNFITRSNSDYLYGDLYGNLFIYKIKPIKHDGIVGWCTTGESHVLYAFNDLFQFVKWEDENPRMIKDILDNCEVVENAKKQK